MNRFPKKLNRFYKQLLQNEKLSYRRALSIYEALHREAVHLGVIRSSNMLEGIEVDLRIARMLQRMKRG